jgi:hypothetical protein
MKGAWALDKKSVKTAPRFEFYPQSERASVAASRVDLRASHCGIGFLKAGSAKMG